jgi:NitT/TauT family transport system permease protein
VTRRQRAARARRARRISAGSVAALLALWELGARAGVVDELFFPAPSAIGAEIAALAADGTFPRHFGATIARTLLGGLLGATPALFAGLAMGWSSRLRAALDPIVAALHPLPKIAVLPLLMVVFGIGESSKVAAIALGAFFPMLINAASGVRQISPLHFDVVRSYGGSPRQVFRRVVLPGALPSVLTGLRLSLNVALLITIAVELVASPTGLGRVIWLAWETLRIERLYATLAVLSALGMAINFGLGRLARRLAPWQPSLAA